jgi:hypothetical protein
MALATKAMSKKAIPAFFAVCACPQSIRKGKPPTTRERLTYRHKFLLPNITPKILLNNLVMSSPLVLHMALCAEFTDHRRIDEIFIFCAVSPVAGQTRQRQVLIPWVYHLIAYGMR